MMFNKEKVKLGIAPIAWTNDDLPDLGGGNTFEQCVSEMALAGFTGSEVGNKYPKDPDILKKALELRGIEICNQWFSGFLLTKPFEEVEKEFRAQLAFLKTMGAGIIGVSEQSYSVQGMQDTPIFGHKYVMNDAEWDIFCKGLNRLGKIAADEYGICLTYHQHRGTVVQDEDEVERMMEETDKKFNFSKEIACIRNFDSKEIDETFNSKHLWIGNRKIPNIYDFVGTVRLIAEEYRDLGRNIYKLGVSAKENIKDKILKNKKTKMLDAPKADINDAEELKSWDLKNWGMNRSEVSLKTESRNCAKQNDKNSDKQEDEQ